MTDVIVISVIALVVGLDVRYIYKKKKSGAVCIGCSRAGCPHRSGGCSCSCGGK